MSMVKVIQWPWFKSLRLNVHQNLNYLLLRNRRAISENAEPISIKFHVQLQGRDGVGNFFWMGQVTWPRWLPHSVNIFYLPEDIEIFFSSTAGLIPMKFGM